MEAQKRTLHPLLTAAAVSVIVFSAVGVAAVTGLIPTSSGSMKEPAPVAALEAPAPAPAPAPVEEAQPAPEPHAASTPKPVHKSVAKAHKPKPATHIAYAETPALAQAPAVVEIQKPVVKPGILGTVEAVREVTQNGSANGIGAVAGGAVGGVLGHQLKHNSNLVTLVGAAAGAFIGNEAQKRQNATKHWELTVRLDDGSTQTIRSEAAPFWHQGDRVRLLEGKLQPV